MFAMKRHVILLSSLAVLLLLDADTGAAHGSESADPTNAESHFQITSLAPDLLMLSTDQGTYSNNSLAFLGDDGLLLVDTHGEADSEPFKRFVDGLGHGTPVFIISTHRHVEHIGGNALWGDEPIIIGHHLLPEKLNSGTFLFSEYPRAGFPDVTFTDTMEIRLNGETIRLVNIGGSHDDNEIMVYFVNHGVAHVSSVVNGFNFPSIDRDGDLLEFEPITRRLMSLLPEDVRLISGHNGKARGFDFVGSWQMLPEYAEMIRLSVERVRAALAAGKDVEDMREAGILDDLAEYAGSYVGLHEWIESVAERLTEAPGKRTDICEPLLQAWKSDGAVAAVALYRTLLDTAPESYDFNEFVMLSIGSKLAARALHEDSSVFLRGGIELYPDSEFLYYSHYLLARSLSELGRAEEAAEHCRRALALNPDFARASELLDELGHPADD